MLCLVAEKEHAQSRADAAAEKGNEKEGCFIYAPFTVYGTALINAHEGKADNGHHGIADEKNVESFHFSGLYASILLDAGSIIRMAFTVSSSEPMTVLGSLSMLSGTAS